MDKFIVTGGVPLRGAVSAGGSKNACLPIITAALLAPGEYRITGVPNLRDVRTIAHLMRVTGAKVDLEDGAMRIDTTHADFPEAPYELVKTMRASIYVLGPLLARFGRARVSLSGGCAWGPRPVDLHIKGMEALGATVTLDGGYINATAERLRGAHIYLDVASVGATGNIMMAAVLADIRSGAFAERFINDQDNGAVEFLELREKAAKHPIEAVGKDLRSLFSWKQQDKDYVEGSAAR